MIMMKRNDDINTGTPRWHLAFRSSDEIIFISDFGHASDLTY
jgi:hypothetical protein